MNELIIEANDPRFKTFAELYPEIEQWKYNGIVYFHFIYLNGDPSQCIIKRGYSNFEKAHQDFERIYIDLEDKSYHKLLLLSTYYGVIPSEKLLHTLNREQFLPCRFDDKTLDKENICIAFNDQVEVLYRTLTGVSPWEAIEFRRDLNKKNQSTIRKSREIKVNDQYNLYDWLCLKSFNEGIPMFLTANFYGAKLLYRNAQLVA